MNLENENELPTISLAAYEAQAARFKRTVKVLAGGWIISAALFVAAVACILN